MFISWADIDHLVFGRRRDPEDVFEVVGEGEEARLALLEGVDGLCALKGVA
jgi:hypothetical protein